jgi:hypothetical protein
VGCSHDERHRAGQVDADRRLHGARPRAGDLEHDQTAAGGQHAKALAERDRKVRGVTERVADRHEVEEPVAVRQLLDAPLDEWSREGAARLAQHAAARIEPDHRAWIQHDVRGGAGDEAGAGRDVEDLHARA